MKRIKTITGTKKHTLTFSTAKDKRNIRVLTLVNGIEKPFKPIPKQLKQIL